jgi:hypothetical protein
MGSGIVMNAAFVSALAKLTEGIASLQPLPFLQRERT